MKIKRPMVKLKKRRQLLGISTRELANEIGVTDSAVRNWECGSRVPEHEHIEAMAEVLGCFVEDIVEDDK